MGDSPEEVACQKCGKFGGRVGCYKLRGILFSRWECPHCPKEELPEGAIREE